MRKGEPSGSKGDLLTFTSFDPDSASKGVARERERETERERDREGGKDAIATGQRMQIPLLFFHKQQQRVSVRNDHK